MKDKHGDRFFILAGLGAALWLLFCLAAISIASAL